MGCFSCFKPSTSEEDPFAAETHIQEDEQLALAIHQSSLQHQEEEERRRTRELEAEERGERQNSHNSSSLENKQQDEQSLKEKDKRKQLEEHVNKDEQLAVTPPPLEEHNNNSSIAPLDEDVDGQRISLKDKGQTKPPRSMCGGCHFEIEHGGSVDVLGVPWHPQCFRCGACHIPIAIHEVQDHVLSNSRGKFHKNCYDWYCYVCEEKVKTKMFKYHQHHFWKEKYCAAHDSDGTPKCCSCERLEPRGTDFVMLDDGRWLCLECMPV
ncbi:hypothetical protein N665_0205s0040 [Sinapis alba]|nr:hypothetical protein N665_0205s0040 [Sinapis alba]